MLRIMFVTALLVCLALRASALPTISVKGAKFFAGGNQFFLKGVAYQGTPNDPLVDTKQCQLDAAAMHSIGTNSIRVYHVDPAADHQGCMSVFSDAEIYVWLDVDTFTSYIIQTDPKWTQEQFAAYAKVVDTFQQYDNLGGFWIGNEVINNLGGSPAAPYIKAAVADMKAYLTAKSYRQIPIGYSAADIAELRPMLQNYLACGDADQAIDFFGLNSYEWCGDATYQTSGYGGLQTMTQGYSIPIFFSETGCNVGGDRTFADQKAIFGPDMIGTWSGSIIYEWVEETNHYGVVTYPNGEIYSGAPIPMQPDFDNLSRVWKSITPTGVSEGSYTPSLVAPACPSATGGWIVDGDVPLPRLGASIIKAVAAGAFVPSSKPSSGTSPQPTVKVTSAYVATSTSTRNTLIISITSDSSITPATKSQSQAALYERGGPGPFWGQSSMKTQRSLPKPSTDVEQSGFAIGAQSTKGTTIVSRPPMTTQAPDIGSLQEKDGIDSQDFLFAAQTPTVSSDTTVAVTVPRSSSSTTHSTYTHKEKTALPPVSRDMIPEGVPTPTDSYMITVTTMPPDLTIHTVVASFNVLNRANETWTVSPSTSSNLSRKYTNGGKLEKTTSTSGTETQDATSTGAAPAATISKSAGSAFRVATPSGVIAYLNNLGGHGGFIGMLITTVSILFGVVAFL
ncbi:uncharacterized protein L3040_003006 [Drepanopeziza brunnea f. sp. 'multigermtubi']|uniref:uncharacterized protein n=1 Tax=Drepanopeziza brunnea f. sp. 'multigermtubi' TaxID=698441 RepID=UPI002384552F|nr:hypothetical protein L3040_003006 [Drepanopeziza brunnea f. sp. 'multigermtubi']